jgi:hypothetical protein
MILDVAVSEEDNNAALLCDDLALIYCCLQFLILHLYLLYHRITPLVNDDKNISLIFEIFWK